MKFIPKIAGILFLSVLGTVFAQTDPKILATNTWTAAYVQMAGGEAQLLAPADMAHPPEYELKVSDVQKIQEADYLVYAGYEVLMKTVFESFQKPKDACIQIETSYDPQAVETSVLKLAEKMNTLPEARKNLAAYKAYLQKAQDELKAAGLYGKKVLVSFHQQALAKALGFEILGVFGPQALSSGDLSRLAKVKPDLIIDNIHSLQAAPFEEIFALKAINLANFPLYTFSDGTKVPEGLLQVLEFNVKKILASK